MAPTYLETLKAFTTFLTAYTHTLLYLRSLYPRTSFVQSRFHNAPVYQSRHPLVCEWIRDAVTAVRGDLLEGTVTRIGIVIFSYGNGEAGKIGSAKIMERYMFDVSAFPVVSKHERNMELDWDSHSEHGDDSGEDSAASDPAPRKKGKNKMKEKELDADVDTNLSEQFRAALIVLATRTSKLSPLPPNCSFNISMELKDEADVDPPIRHPQPWIPVQPSLQKTGRNATVRDEDDEADVAEGRQKVGEDLGGVKVTPIRGVELGTFKFDTWVEEGKAKFEGQSSDSTKTSFASSKA